MKNIVSPQETISFSLVQPLFLEGLGIQESKQEVIKFTHVEKKMAEVYPFSSNESQLKLKDADTIKF